MTESLPPTDPRQHVASEMAAGIAHEFNNMLASMVGLSDLLRTDPRLPPELVEDAERIYQSTLNGAERVRQIQKIAGRPRPKGSLDSVDVVPLLRTVRDQRVSDIHSIDVRCDGACTVMAQESDLLEVLQRLVDNAIEATPAGGRIELGTRIQGGRVEIWVSDDGPGISPAIRDRVCEPFFTTHDQRRGRGLGLAIAQGLTSSFRGTIAVGDSVGGARFEVSLPAAVEAPEAPVAQPVVSVPPAGGRVLIVDDDATIRDVLLRMLRMDGHEGVGAESGEAALEEIARGTFDVVVTDLGMPGMNGLELAAELRTRMPEAVVVLSSGWTDAQQSACNELDNIAFTVNKPVEYEAFAKAMNQALQIRKGEASSA